MVMEEVYIGIITYPIPTIIHVILVYHRVYLFIMIIYVDIGLIPDILIHIIIVDYTFPPNFPPEYIPKGVWL